MFSEHSSWRLSQCEAARVLAERASPLTAGKTHGDATAARPQGVHRNLGRVSLCPNCARTTCAHSPSSSVTAAGRSRKLLRGLPCSPVLDGSSAASGDSDPVGDATSGWDPNLPRRIRPTTCYNFSLKQRSAGAVTFRRLLILPQLISTSAKFFTRLYALDKDGSRRRRTVRLSTGSGAPIGSRQVEQLRFRGWFREPRA